MKFFENAPEVALPAPAGLETEPGPGLIFARDNRKMLEVEKCTQTTPRRRQYYGLPAKPMWILAIVLVLVVIAVAVGFGTGVVVSRHLASSAGPISSSTGAISSSLAATATTNAPLSPLPTSTISRNAASHTAVAGGCVNGTTYVSSDYTSFIEFCNTDFGTGALFGTYAADWNLVANIGTFASCMDTCAIYKKGGISALVAAGTCLSVSWVAGGTTAGICYLKNMTAMIANGNATAESIHAVPHNRPSFQSANMVGHF